MERTARITGKSKGYLHQASRDGGKTSDSVGRRDQLIWSIITGIPIARAMLLSLIPIMPSVAFGVGSRIRSFERLVMLKTHDVAAFHVSGCDLGRA